jgi:Ca2+-binding EF-hand superfamily protein
MSFADFLDVMHIHSTKESIPKELIDAFKGSDPGKKGVIPAKDLWNILTKWGEKISPREGWNFTGNFFRKLIIYNFFNVEF